MPRPRHCTSCGVLIKLPTYGELLARLCEAHGDLTTARPWYRPEGDEVDDNDPQVLRYRRNQAVDTLRHTIHLTTRMQCGLCDPPLERLPRAPQG